MDNGEFAIMISQICVKCRGKGRISIDGRRSACNKCLGVGKITAEMSIEELAKRLDQVDKIPQNLPAAD